MNRRELLRLLATGLVGHALDVDKLLWVPGAKTIFIPEIQRLTASQIMALEMQRLYDSGIIKELFERQDIFNRLIMQSNEIVGRKKNE